MLLFATATTCVVDMTEMMMMMIIKMTAMLVAVGSRRSLQPLL